MKSKIISLYLIFSVLLFTSFASENKSEILSKKEISKAKNFPQKTNLIQSKKQKNSFKEYLALKFAEKKIKKSNRKQSVNTNKARSLVDIIFIFTSVLLFLGGIISGIIYISLGKTLLGIVLLLGGLILIPLIFMIIFVGLFMGNRTREYNQKTKE